MWSSEVWNGMVTKVSGGEHTALRYEASIPLTCLSVLLRYLYNFSIMGNTSVSRATPPSWPKKGLGCVWLPSVSRSALLIILEYGGNKATSVSFLLDAYRSLHTLYWLYNSWFLFLSICFPRRLNPCHTCGLCWLSSSWASFLYQHFLSLPWHVSEQNQIV